VAKKGFYLKNNPKENCLYLNVFVSDFKSFLDTLPQTNGWVRLRIFERLNEDEKGHTHNMEVVVNPKHIKEQGGDDE
jgi:hypothetical protein